MTVAPTILRQARQRAGLSARALARRAGTSHATLLAYESGAKVPTVDTLTRVVRAAGFVIETELSPRVADADREARGRELADLLELAALFPARHDPQLRAPIFGRAAASPSAAIIDPAPTDSAPTDSAPTDSAPTDRG